MDDVELETFMDDAAGHAQALRDQFALIQARWDSDDEIDPPRRREFMMLLMTLSQDARRFRREEQRIASLAAASADWKFLLDRYLETLTAFRKRFVEETEQRRSHVLSLIGRTANLEHIASQLQV